MRDYCRSPVGIVSPPVPRQMRPTLALGNSPVRRHLLTDHSRQTKVGCGRTSHFFGSGISDRSRSLEMLYRQVYDISYWWSLTYSLRDMGMHGIP